KVRQVAADVGVPIHMDGARIWNAAAAAGVEATEWTSQVDTVMFCLSKGLGAPIGSLVCGSGGESRGGPRDSILYGGAWRRAGIVAAAGLVALDEGRARIPDDHARARRLAQALTEIAPSAVDPETVETNMVFVHTEAVGLEPLDAVGRLAALGVGA